MVKQAHEERRQGIRAKRILSIQYRLAKGKGKAAEKKWHLSTTHDMSIVGLSFLSDKAYEMGDVLEVHVVMSGILDIYKGLAKVVRVERKKAAAFYFIAVKFQGVKSRARKAKTYSRKKRRIKVS